MKKICAVMIIPTGIGAEIGGHSGDANPATQLLAEVCDRLIIHPNVVNASDLNEMPKNTLYVEGSALDLFLAGKVFLKEVKRNKILVACNKAGPDTINAVNAARAVMGIEATIVELQTPLNMTAKITENGATGDITGEEGLIHQVEGLDFDVLAIHTPITVSPEIIENYQKNAGINPWGGVEAKLSKIISERLDKPVAHAPVETSDVKVIVDPRIAPEYIGVHLVSVLKGLKQAPQLVKQKNKATLIIEDIDAMISPICWGTPHNLCVERDIPIIFVKDNTTIKKAPLERGICVNNYLEAAGVLLAFNLGISLDSIKRPLKTVKII